MTKGQTP